MQQELELETDMGMCLAHGDSNEGSTPPALALMTGVGPGLSPGLTLPPTTQGGSAARVGPS